MSDYYQLKSDDVRIAVTENYLEESFGLDYDFSDLSMKILKTIKFFPRVKEIEDLRQSMFSSMSRKIEDERLNVNDPNYKPKYICLPCDGLGGSTYPDKFAKGVIMSRLDVVHAAGSVFFKPCGRCYGHGWTHTPAEAKKAPVRISPAFYENLKKEPKEFQDLWAALTK